MDTAQGSDEHAQKAWIITPRTTRTSEESENRYVGRASRGKIMVIRESELLR